MKKLLNAGYIESIASKVGKIDVVVEVSLGLTFILRCFDLVIDGLKNCAKHDLAKGIEQLKKLLTLP